MSEKLKPKILSGDQAAFSHWDSVIKLAGLQRHVQDSGGDYTVYHQFHLIDGIGRHNDETPAQFHVTNEYFLHRDGREVQPSWFAVADAMPFITLETISPRKVGAVLNRKFDQVAEDIVDILPEVDDQTKQKISQTSAQIGVEPTIPADKPAVYKKLTESNWYGIVDAEGHSASVYNFADIGPAQRELTRILYRELRGVVAPENRRAMQDRFRQLVGTEGTVYPTIKDKTLSEASEAIYRLIAPEIKRITGVDISTVLLGESTDYATLPGSSEEYRGDEAERFLFLDWYLQHRDLYDRAHNKVAEVLSKKGENPINTIAVKKGEVPFWIVNQGKKHKLFIQCNEQGTQTEIVFGDRRIKLVAPVTDHKQLAEVLSSNFPDELFAVAPTAIGLLFQIRANGTVLLPERGSTYTNQANMVWHEIAQQAATKDLLPIMQNNTIRVHPHTVAALPDNQRIKLPSYVRAGFPTDEEGYTTTDAIKTQWQELIEARNTVTAAAVQAKTLPEKAAILFAGNEFQHVHEVASQLQQMQDQELKLAEQRSGVMSAMRQSLQKNEMRRLGDIGKYIEGNASSLPDGLSIPEELVAQIETTRAAFAAEDIDPHHKKQLETILSYYIALQYKMLEGGVEALEYFDARPSLMTLYLLFGEDVVRNIIANAEVYVEETDVEPIIDTAEVNAEGNNIYVVEDKLGWAKADSHKRERFIQSLVTHLRESNLDTATIITHPSDDEADYDLVIVEKDGSISNMCGNGVRAVAYYMAERYNYPEVKLKSKAGEIVVGFKEDEGTYGARLSEIVILGSESTTRFSDLLSEDIANCDKPLVTIRELADQAGVRVPIISVRHVLQEPHMIVGLPENTDREALRQEASALMTLADANGNKVFPNGININFAGRTEETFYLLTYERGVDDFTGSCGTGAVCTASLAMENLGVDTVTFTTGSGHIRVSYESGHYIIHGHASQRSSV